MLKIKQNNRDESGLSLTRLWNTVPITWKTQPGGHLSHELKFNHSYVVGAQSQKLIREKS